MGDENSRRAEIKVKHTDLEVLFADGTKYKKCVNVRSEERKKTLFEGLGKPYKAPSVEAWDFLKAMRIDLINGSLDQQDSPCPTRFPYQGSYSKQFFG